MGTRVNALNEKPNAEMLPRRSEASTILDGRYAPPPKDQDGKIWIRTSAMVNGPAEKLYRMWRDVESAPLWQEQIVSVVRTGERTSHWVMQVNDKRVEWDSEVLNDEPGKRIAWRSIGGDSDNAGEVIFERAPGRPRHDGYGTPGIQDEQARKRLGNLNGPKPETSRHREPASL